MLEPGERSREINQVELSGPAQNTECADKGQLTAGGFPACCQLIDQDFISLQLFSQGDSLSLAVVSMIQAGIWRSAEWLHLKPGRWPGEPDAHWSWRVWVVQLLPYRGRHQTLAEQM